MVTLPAFDLRCARDLDVLEKTPLDALGLPASTYELIQQLAGEYGERTALRYLPTGAVDEDAVSFTYREVFAAITQTANAFHALGVRERDVVSMLLPNLPHTHFTLWGGEAAGIVSPINTLLEAEHIAAIVNEVEAKILVTVSPASDPVLWEKAEKVIARAPSIEHVLTVDMVRLHSYGDERDEGSGLNAKTFDFDDFISLQNAGKLDSGRVFAPSDIASYFHTGGTTGAPKLAPHTHENEVVCTVQTAMALNGGHDEPAATGLCGLPLFHIYAVFINGLSLLLTGGEIVLASPSGFRTPAVLENFWPLVEKYKVNMIGCVPTILSELLKYPSDAYDLSSLRYAVSGSAPLATELARTFEETTGLVLVEGFGQTECPCAVTLNPRRGERRIGSVGLRTPYCKVRVVELDHQGKLIRDCEPDEAGVVVVSGPNVFSGYKNPKHNKNIWVEPGWLNTGDLGRFDRDGYLWLIGRSKDLIIRGGHNIDPKLIEEAFYKHDAVAEAAAVGKPDRRLGELPVLFVQLKPGAGVSAEELRAFGAAAINERAAHPKEIFLIDAMPVTAVGKIFKPSLRSEAVRRLVHDELSAIKDTPFHVESFIHKTYGQSVMITAPPDRHEEIEAALRGYTFSIELRAQA